MWVEVSLPILCFPYPVSDLLSLLTAWEELSRMRLVLQMTQESEEFLESQH